MLALLVAATAICISTCAPTLAAAATTDRPVVSGGGYSVGIADQKADMFDDRRFLALGVRHVRRAIAWDVRHHADELSRLDDWMEGARRANVRPLLTFMHASGDRRRVLPTPQRLARELRMLRARYGQRIEWATWNEANHCGEPTCHRPQLVARYYRELRKACPRCTILGASVIDMPNMESWVREFERSLPSGVRPPIWGLHNYLDANRFRTSGTRTLLRATRGRVWFTETGGIVSRVTRTKVRFPEGPANARKAVRWLLRRLALLSPRIDRVYLYHWNSQYSASWDSALIAPSGRERSSLGEVRSAILRQATNRKFSDGESR